MSAKNITSQNIIQYSMYKPMFSYIMFTVVGGNSAVYSWDPRATNGPVARLNNFFQTIIDVPCE
jgi:hypothetical protein